MSTDIRDAKDINWDDADEVKELCTGLLIKHRAHLRQAIINSAYRVDTDVVRFTLNKLTSLHEAFLVLAELDKSLKNVKEMKITHAWSRTS